MPLPVSLRAVIEEMEIQRDESSSYLNRHTGELITISHDEIEVAEAASSAAELARLPGWDERPQWERELITQAAAVIEGTDYLQLPSKFDLHEWQVMEKFSYACRDEATRERLLDAIRGRGAFRRFRQVLEQAELVDDWYRFREGSIAQVAMEWLEANGIAYQRDYRE